MTRIQSGEVDAGRAHLPNRPSEDPDSLVANTYVNLGVAGVIGFDYDYTLVRYKTDVLFLLYELAKDRLVNDFRYPAELLQGQRYDPEFAIRGLAVDLENAWICKLTSSYRVASAFYGRRRVTQNEVREMYKSERGTGIQSVDERMRRLRPLNDHFSMVEACLLADVVQWFTDRKIRFDPRSVVTDVIKAVGKVHTSGQWHRTVVEDKDRYMEPDPEGRLLKLLRRFKAAGKKLMLTSNSEFWYVDAGMSHVVGEKWRRLFDIVVAPAGKPAFYTQSRPFREVDIETGQIKYDPITELSPQRVYCEGSIAELSQFSGLDMSRVIYFGDSLMADLVEARRLWGWTTGAIIPEVHEEKVVQRSAGWRRDRRTLCALRHSMRLCQQEMRSASESRRLSNEDCAVLDSLEHLAASSQGQDETYLNPNFGSIFRTRQELGSTPSFFARCLQRHVDLYTSSVENLALYSTDHRFYPREQHVGIPTETSHLNDLLAGIDAEDDEDDAAAEDSIDLADATC